MSTRSGKRIHGSIHENAVNDVIEVKSERKTRGKRLVENCVEIATEKKRKHYVRYPSEEDLAAASNGAYNKEKIPKSARKSQRNTLKEPNILATDSETSNDDRSGRRTRRTRKAEAVDTAENIDPNNEIKIKSKGKNKTKSLIVNDDNTFETEIHTIKKKSNKKKHKRNSGSVDIVNDIIPQTTDGKNNLSCMSVDSFYSAAGSPVKEYHKIDNNLKILDMPSKSTRSHDKVIENEVEDHQVQDIPLKATRRSKNHEKKGKLQEIPLKATRSNEKYCEEIVERDQIQEMPSKATRSKMHSLKNISLEDADSKTTKSKGTKRKRKLTDEKAFNNSLTKTTNDDVNNFSKVGILPIIQITDCGATQDTQHTNSFSSSPGFNNSLKNSNKKRRSKTNSTNDKVENSSTFEIETVNNIKTPDKLLKLDTSKGNSAKKNSSYDTINDNINTTFDKEISNNSVNQTDKSQDVLAKGTKDSLKKKRKSTIDINNVSEANLITTFGKDITNYFVNHSEHVQDDSTNINGTKSNNRRKTNSTSDKIKPDTITNLNAPFEKEIIDSINHSDYSQDDTTNRNSTKKSNKKKRKSTYDKIRFSETSSNSTFDEKTPQKPINESVESHQNVSTSGVKNKKKSSIKESISDKMVIDTSIINLDATYEKDNSYNQQTVHNNARETTPRKSGQCSTFQDQGQDITSNLNTTYDKNSINGSQHISLNNSTFDKSAKFNTTFEMVKNTKLDATFEKSENNDARRGSSLISSDTTDNVSSEMSKDISRVSITSDESVMDNIVNTTPVLIESSVDESQINISSNENKIMQVDAQTKNVSPPLKLQKEYEETRYVSTHEGTSTENTKTPPKSEETLTDKKTYVTPLKKDGTYTEIKYDTPPKREGIFTKKKGSTTPKDKGVFTETKGQNTPKAKESFEEDKGSTTPSRERTYTKLKTPITPLKREGTYTELNPKSTPPQNNTNTENKTKTPIKLNGLVVNKLATPPLNREDTFTKDSDVPESPKVKFDINKTPTRRKSLPSPGRTPFPLSKSASKERERSEQSVLNITRSAEKSKRRSSMVALVQRATKVMFCSPVDTPMVTGQKKGTVIKSNLKGSDKSFLFDESVSDHGRPPRKRSYTQSEADGLSSKRKRLTHDQQQSVERLARPRTASASGKLQDPGTPSKRASALNKSRNEVTPSKAKAEGRVLRTRLPNFAALHQKRFAKMESLDECQLRKAKRARQLLTPTGPVSVLERVSPKEAQSASSSTESQPNKLETSKKTIIPPENQGYTRFGFKLNIDVANPFNFTAKTETKPKEPKEGRLQPPERHTTSLCPLPSRAGATRVRKEAAKQTIMREKSFTDRRDINRKENRTIIKGVRTNRRFELQMQMRNVNQ